MPEAPASLPPAVVVIAGVDPTAGAGLGADLAVLQAMGCQGLPGPTAWTVQDGHAVRSAGALTGAAVEAMLGPLAELAPAAVKVGMLCTEDVVEAVIAWIVGLERRPAVVVDPVISSSSGARLLNAAGVARLREGLLPLASLVTPNLDEARVLAPDAGPTAVDLARALVDQGAQAAVVTGGHGAGDPADVLFDGAGAHRFVRPRLSGAHGTGCRFASGCAAGLAHGRDIPTAVKDAGDALALALAGPRRGPADLLTIPP